MVVYLDLLVKLPLVVHVGQAQQSVHRLDGRQSVKELEGLVIGPEVSVVKLGVGPPPVDHVLEDPLVLLPPLAPGELVLLTFPDDLVVGDELPLLLGQVLELYLPFELCNWFSEVEGPVQLLDPLLYFVHLPFVPGSLPTKQDLLGVLINKGLEMVLAEHRDHIARVYVARVLLDQPLHSLLVHGTR